MQHADDPPRLLDDPDAAGDLRLGLERFSRDLPGPERLARLAAALGVDPTPPANPAPTAGKSLAAKFALGGGAVDRADRLLGPVRGAAVRAVPQASALG